MGFFNEIADGIGSVIGTTVGVVVGISASAIALTLGCSVKMAQTAIDSGCKTAEEVEEFLGNL